MCTNYSLPTRVRALFTTQLHTRLLLSRCSHPPSPRSADTLLHPHHNTVDPVAFDGERAVRELCRAPCVPSSTLLPQLSLVRGGPLRTQEVPLQEAVRQLGAAVALAGTGGLIGGAPPGWETAAAVHRGRGGASAAGPATVQQEVGGTSHVPPALVRHWIEVR
jgi:hypothetical protein